MTRTLQVTCDAVPGLDDGQMRRLALGNLFGETDPDMEQYLRTTGIERYYAALHGVSANIADQLAAYNAGRFVREDPEWAKRAGRLKERIDRVMPDLRAMRTTQRQLANGGYASRYHQLVDAVCLHRAAKVDAGPTHDDGTMDDTDLADQALWATLVALTADDPE